MSKILFLACCGIFSIIGVILVAVAFSTDKWLTYEVDEKSLKSDTEKKEYNNSYKIQNPQLYNNRDRGLFRVCFDKADSCKY